MAVGNHSRRKINLVMRVLDLGIRHAVFLGEMVESRLFELQETKRSSVVALGIRFPARFAGDQSLELGWVDRGVFGRCSRIILNAQKRRFGRFKG